ncbi:hypothetical protein ScPMuIL_005799 [Solemya velum]
MRTFADYKGAGDDVIEDVSYYFFSTETGDWNYAEKACVGRGGYLLEVDTNEENIEIEGYLLPLTSAIGFWIGARRNAKTESSFIWSHSGRSLTFQNWHQGEPNNAGGNEDCVHIFYPLGDYMD